MPVEEPHTPMNMALTTTPYQQRTWLSRTSPASFLQGTRGFCLRHGRLPKDAQTPLLSPEAARGGQKDLAKSRNGGYFPTGLMHRRQVEATSPYAVLPEAKDEACPDCSSELRIKRRELMSSTNPVSSDENADDGMVIVEDLGEKMDAVIVEHQGALRKVFLNSRQGRPDAATMQRLSKELAQVSRIIAIVDPNHPHASPAISTEGGEQTLIVSAPHETRTSSVPELLTMIDAAAKEIHANTGHAADHYINRRPTLHAHENSLLSNSDLHDVLADHDDHAEDGLVMRQGIGQHYHALHRRLAEAALDRRDTITYIPSIASPSPASVQKMAEVKPIPPQIITTRPTLPTKSAEVSPLTTQTPPPEHPGIHHAPELVATPTPSPSPKPEHDHEHHHGHFSFLNPWHRHGAPSTPVHASGDLTPSTPSTASSVKRARPADESPPSTTPQPVEKVANPYHHAPHSPLHAADVAHGSSEVSEKGRETGERMRAEHEKMLAKSKAKAETEVDAVARKVGSPVSVKDVATVASAGEREARRKRSLGTGLKPAGRGVGGRKGWFS